MSEAEERQRVVDEAYSWLRTPYHPEAKLKGIGVDCGQLLIMVYANAGMIADFDTGYYPPDWHLHRSDERYRRFVIERAKPTLVPKPGDLVLYKLARCFAHGAIIIDWPTIIHSHLNIGVCLADAEKEQALMYVGAPSGDKPRAHEFYTLW